MAEYKKILQRAARLCSTSEKATKEIRLKLISWGLNEEEAEKAIRHLQKEQFLDEDRYAGYFVKDKLKINKWGKVKIRHMLRQKGIAESAIENALSMINEELYTEVLDQLLSTKLKSLGDPSNLSEKARLFSFAAQRGFTMDEVHRSLDRIINSKDPDQ